MRPPAIVIRFRFILMNQTPLFLCILITLIVRILLYSGIEFYR